MNMDDFLKDLNFGDDGETDDLRYLKLDMGGMELRHAVDAMLAEALDMDDFVMVRAAADSLRKFVYGLCSVYIHDKSDPAQWYIDACTAFDFDDDGALEMLDTHRRMARHLAQVAGSIRPYLPGSSDRGGSLSPYPVNDVAELRVSPFWEIGFPFIVAVGAYINSDAPEVALAFIQALEGNDFLAWMNRELVVLARLGEAAVQIIDEAAYRVQNGALTDDD